MTETQPAQEPTQGALAAALWAGVVLVACETSHGVALRWDHAGGYVALNWALTLGFSFVLGAVGKRLGALWVFVLWAGVGAGFVGGMARGVGVGLAAALVAAVLSSSRCRARREAPIVGACAGAGFFLALVFTRRLATTAGLDALPAQLGEAVAAGLLYALVPISIPIALGRFGRYSAGLLATAVGIVAALLAAQPVLHAPSGRHRLPPAGYASSVPRTEREQRPDIFLLVLDTVRADHLSIYGYGRDTTPELIRWTRARPNALVVQHAYANGTWTVPSHASLLTGRLPNEHGAHFALDGSVRWRFGIEAELPTVAEALQESGYATLGTFANNWLRIVSGMGRGFDRYFRSHHADPYPGLGEGLRRRVIPALYMDVEKSAARAATVNATLLSMVRPWSVGPNPVFAFANFGDAHGPYAPPKPFRGRFHSVTLQERPGHLALAQEPSEHALLAARYDEEIAYLDSQLGALLDEFAALGVLDEAWVFITSDHGEAFAEHGVTEHGTTVHDEVTRIPLIIFPPVGIELPAPMGAVSLVDVSATIAAIAGVDLAGPGRDLRGTTRVPQPTHLEFYGDAWKADVHGASAALATRAVIEWPYKLIERNGASELFDLALDPGESTDVAPAHPALVVRLRGMLSPFGQAVTVAGGAASPSDLDALRDLGYVGVGD